MKMTAAPVAAKRDKVVPAIKTIPTQLYLSVSLSLNAAYTWGQQIHLVYQGRCSIKQQETPQILIQLR